MKEDNKITVFNKYTTIFFIIGILGLLFFGINWITKFNVLPNIIPLWFMFSLAFSSVPVFTKIYQDGGW